MYDQSFEGNSQAAINMTDLFRKHLPGVPMFPIQGNHEFFPSNVQNFTDIANDPLVHLLADEWAEYLGEEATAEFREKSYYSVQYDENTRIIAINTQNCYIYNFYLIGELTDPLGELQWLEDTLREMEAAGQVAIIMGHVPPGSMDCVQSYAGRYRALMDRFQHVVRL